MLACENGDGLQLEQLHGHLQCLESRLWPVGLPSQHSSDDIRIGSPQAILIALRSGLSSGGRFLGGSVEPYVSTCSWAEEYRPARKGKDDDLCGTCIDIAPSPHPFCFSHSAGTMRSFCLAN